MSQILRLFDLFGDFTAAWPTQTVVEEAGAHASSDPAQWLASLNNLVGVKDVRTASGSQDVSVEAALWTPSGFPTYPQGFPFAITSMPDVQLLVQPVPETSPVRLFSSVSDLGCELLLEGLPVEIQVPSDLLMPHPLDESSASVVYGQFAAGRLDQVRVELRAGSYSSIFVHLRMRVTVEGRVVFTTAVPISVGRCRLSGLPCRALHDLVLLPSMRDARTTFEWVRHSAANWLLGDEPRHDGGFGVRSVDLDPEHEPISKLIEGFNERTEQPEAEEASTAAFVLDDLIVPFADPFVLPIPRHITAGFRRNITNWADQTELFSFARAPLYFRFGEEGKWAVFIDHLYYRSRSLDPAQGQIDPGLHLSGGLVYAADSSQPVAIGFEVGEELTLRLSVRRQFGEDGLPAPEEAWLGAIQSAVSAEIAGVKIDLMALKVGISLGRVFQERYGFGDSLEILGDVFVFMPPTGEDKAFFRMRSLSGEKIAFLIEDVGWKFGSPSIGGISLPDGVALYFGPVGLVLQEIAMIAERGASYLSLTAGLAIEPPGGTSGGFLLKRLRFRAAGNPEAPAFMLDGVFGWIQWPTGKIEIGGYYTERLLNPTTLHREFGLAGTLALDTGPLRFLVAVDVLIGSITKINDPAQSFGYFMGQVFYRGPLAVVYGIEIRNLRLLFARNVLPKLSPVNQSSAELRYLNWYQSSNPTNVPGDRRLAAWQPANHSIAVGAGTGASFAACGSVFELFVFVLVIAGEEENGFLVVAELYMLFAPKAIAYAAIEYDIEHGRFSVAIGMSLSVKTFIEDTPDWLNDVGKLTGTLLISNSPGTVAIGKIPDQRTWLTWSMMPSIPLVGSAGFSVAICFEWLDGQRIGGGLAVRFEGGPDYGVVQFVFHASIGFVYTAFLTTSKDHAAVIYVEVGARAVVLFFLRFGVSAGAEWRYIGPSPSRSEWNVKLRFETPWFVPDVTFMLQFAQGGADLEQMSVATSALRSAALVHEPTQAEHRALVERRDPDWTGSGRSRTYSVRELRAGVRPEAERLGALRDQDGPTPCPTDATIAIEFSVPITDLLHLESGIEAAEPQRSGDLSLRYELVGLRIRRRPRFDPAAGWELAQEQRALAATFTGAGGVQLNGAFEPAELNHFWDPDVKVDARRVAKKLLINARTPFSFKTRDDESDDRTLGENPSWPCCGGRKKPGTYPEHKVEFRQEPAGSRIAGARTFTQSTSRLGLLAAAYARPSLFAAGSNQFTVAFLEASAPKVLARGELTEPAVVVRVRYALENKSQLGLWLVALDANAGVVGSAELTSGGAGGMRTATVTGSSEITSLEVRTEHRPVGGATRRNWRGDAKGTLAVELDELSYVSVRDFALVTVRDKACDSSDPAWRDRYEGRGKVFFLPNHEYEIEVTTSVTLDHPGEGEVAADLREYVYFRTKGLPGLNAVSRVGEELEPYVRRAYAGGRGFLYRCEPVAVQLDDGLSIALPLAVRPAGSLAEHVVLFELALTAEPTTVGPASVRATATAPDWIVTNRQVASLGGRVRRAYEQADGRLVAARSRSQNPQVERLARLTQRPGASCGLGDPRDVTTPVLLAMPLGQADPLDTARQLWSAGSRFDATVRAARAGFVHRESFEPADKTAFTFAIDHGWGGADGWDVDGGVLRATAPGRHFALFGENDPNWTHLQIRARVRAEAAAAGVGVAVLATGMGVVQGLFVAVERDGGTLHLRIRRRMAPGEHVEAASAVLPDPGQEPIELMVTAFDDLIRAEAGDATVEVERGELRGGRLCLFADGPAAIENLAVKGLPLFRFPVQVSRYRDFIEHISSFSGSAVDLPEGAMGPGVGTESATSLWSRTGLQILDVMRPEATPSARQVIFDTWTDGLGIPTNDDIDRLEVSRVVRAGATHAVLIESPEPLDFTEEVKFELRRRVRHSPRPPLDWARLRAIAERLGLVHALGHLPSSDRRTSLAEEGVRALRAWRTPTRNTPPDVSTSNWFQDLGVRRHGDRLVITRREPGPAAERLPLIVELELTEHGDLVGRVFTLRRANRQGTTLVAIPSRTIRTGNIGEVLPQALRGVLLSVDLLTGSLVGAFAGVEEEWALLNTAVLQNADATRALVVPLSGGSATPAPSGTYRLILTLDRPRWSAAEAPGELSRMQQSSEIELHL